jgi:titin
MRVKQLLQSKLHRRALVIALLVNFFPQVPAVAANPACNPTTSTVNGLTVLEFTNPNVNDSNTTGSNIGYTCDWTVPTNVYSVTAVIVGGGGSGGFGNQGGGGGGGEVVYTTNGVFLTPGTVKTIVVGTGGAATTAPANIPGNSGANSSYDGVIAHGGGGGGSGGPYSSASVNSGISGGSSGGGNRFGSLVVAPNKTSATDFTSLGNAGGKGAGKNTNDPASATQCAPFGAGGGGGGAMHVGGDATASCSDSSTAGSVSVTVGIGGAGAYLLGKCVGGGGASLAGTSAPPNPSITTGSYNFGTITVNQAPRSACIDPATNQEVVGTFSGGGSGNATSSGVANTGGGGSGVPLDYGRPQGGSGVVLLAYDPSFPPVSPNISTQPQSKTSLSMTIETLTVAASVNDSGTVSYQWQSAPAGSTTFTDIASSTSTTFVTPVLTPSLTGIQYRVRVTNTKSSRTASTNSSISTITVNRRTTTLSLSYPDSNTPRYFAGETLTATFSTNSDSATAATFTSLSSASLCTVNSTTGLISVISPGQCLVKVSVPASNRYESANLTVSVTVRNALQVVRWSSLPSIPVYSPAIQLGTTPGYALATGETATGSGTISYFAPLCNSFSITTTGRITPIALGSCRIRAVQAATSTFDAGDAFETLTVVATPPDTPFINSVSSSGGSTPTSGQLTVSLTSGNENGASITSYLVTATPPSGPAIQETLTAGAGTRTVTVGGLTLGTSYTVTASALNSAGRSSDRTYSRSVTPAGVPFGVSALTATPGDTTLTIGYTAPASLNGGTWDRYQYFITPTGTPFSDTPTAISLLQATTSYTFTGLNNGAPYDVKVVALTSANGSASSANTTLLNLIPAVAPQAPTIAISRLSGTSVRINWYSTSSGGSPITNFAITVTKNTVAQSCYVNLFTTSCTLTGINALDAITASATATNLIGTSPASATIAYSHSTAPLSPSGITTTTGDTFISIAFTQPSSGDQVIDYEYSSDGTTFTSLGTTQSPIVITGLTNDLSYSFFIRAVGVNYGTGAISETITATPGIPAPPPPPPAPPTYSGGNTQVIVLPEVDTSTALEETKTVVIETPTAVIDTKTAQVHIPVTETITTVIKISIRMEVAFNINSYFVNAAAREELATLIKKYRRAEVISVLTIGYSSPSLVNPYPSKLGLWRANAIAKTMRDLGLKTTYTSKYGGLFNGSRKDARKVRIILSVRKTTVTTT